MLTRKSGTKGTTGQNVGGISEVVCNDSVCGSSTSITTGASIIKSSYSNQQTKSAVTQSLKPRMSERGYGGLSETCALSRRQASILSKKRAAEELELARQQELEAECQAEATKKAKKEHPPPAWSELEKDVFFQGIMACGRDFDKLYKFYQAKTKSMKSSGGERSKDQIRHFYYRTVKNLHSIINMQRVSKNKEANELFAMINWAEFRRKITGKLSLLTKHSEKLKQLIYTGETKFKHRGKYIKMKTPTCAPLTRLIEKARDDRVAAANTSGDKKKSSAQTTARSAKLPDLVCVELQPKTNAAWQRVNDISHNPHLRLKVKSDQSLSALIQAIEKKWVPASSRFRRELKLEEEWEKLPFIKLHPLNTSKLQPYDLSLITPNTHTILSFDEYLSLNREDSVNDGTRKDKSKDPVKFLKDKLNDITSQLQGDGSNGADPSLSNENTEPNAAADNLTKSHEWITLATTHGWTAANSTDLSIGCLYLLHGSPEKILLEYEWPDLERSDEVIHIFAGMINRLITVADNEHTNQTNRRKQNTTGSPSTNTKSPSTRGRKASPSTPKSTSLVNIRPLIQKDSPEFKKPGVPLYSENRQLADAIALGRQELRPYARKQASRPMLIQRTIVPNRLITPEGLNHRLATSNQTPATIKTMDISCILSNKPATIISTKFTTNAGSSVPTNSESVSSTPLVQSILSSHVTAASTRASELSSSLTRLISSVSKQHGEITHTSTASSVSVSSEVNLTLNNDDSISQDLLSQAMAAIKTPVKRRITPTLISSNVSSTSGDKSLLSDHSLSSLLNTLNEGVLGGDNSVLAGNGDLMESSSPAVSSFKGLIAKQNEEEMVPIMISQSNTELQSSALQIKDAWLTPDITLSDFSLSSLLGEKSPRRNAAESQLTTASIRLPDQPTAVSLADDTRLSFLHGDLGLDSNLPNLMLNDSSIDYGLKFDSLDGTLETPKKAS